MGWVNVVELGRSPQKPNSNQQLEGSAAQAMPACTLHLTATATTQHSLLQYPVPLGRVRHLRLQALFIISSYRSNGVLGHSSIGLVKLMRGLYQYSNEWFFYSAG